MVKCVQSFQHCLRLLCSTHPELVNHSTLHNCTVQHRVNCFLTAASPALLLSVHFIVQPVIIGRWAFLRVCVALCRIITNIYRALLVADSAQRWTGRAWAYFKERKSPQQALISQQNEAHSWFPGQVEDAWPPHQLVQLPELFFLFPCFMSQKGNGGERLCLMSGEDIRTVCAFVCTDCCSLINNNVQQMRLIVNS